MALFSRADRTFNLELAREGSALVERVHLDHADTQREQHDSEHAALAAYRQRFVEIVNEGWHLVLGDPDIARPVACDPTIEAAISIDDREQLAVYADWLIERGDPCGELAALRARAEAAPTPALTTAIAELEEARGDEIFGLYAGLVDQGVIELAWTHGWVTTIRVGQREPARPPPYRHHPESSHGTLVGIVLLAPIARFVRHLEFPRVHTSDVRSAIATSPRRDSIRQLTVTSPHHVQELLDVMPKLEILAMPAGTKVRGHASVDTIKLAIDTPEVIPDLLQGEWPSLRSVSITSRRDISAALAMLAERPLMATLRVLEVTAPLETPIIRVLREAHPHIDIKAS
ncbi:MAG: Molybdate metabolism regulator [Myxococcales bacterium]|nr:Molybdate metabolism regulator [Myxococcales bacterium]